MEEYRGKLETNERFCFVFFPFYNFPKFGQTNRQSP